MPRHLPRRPHHRRSTAGIRHRRCVELRRARDLRLHHARGGAAHTADRAGEAWLSLDDGSGRDTSSGGSANTRAGESGGADCLGAGLFRRRRALDGHGDDLLAAEEDEAERAAVLAVASFGWFLALGRRKFAELLAIAEDEVHVAVEGHEFSDELTTVLNGDTHTVVDVLKHLGTLRHRHFGKIGILFCSSFFSESVLGFKKNWDLRGGKILFTPCTRLD